MIDVVEHLGSPEPPAACAESELRSKKTFMTISSDASKRMLRENHTIRYTETEESPARTDFLELGLDFACGEIEIERTDLPEPLETDNFRGAFSVKGIDFRSIRRKYARLLADRERGEHYARRLYVAKTCNVFRAIYEQRRPRYNGYREDTNKDLQTTHRLLMECSHSATKNTTTEPISLESASRRWDCGLCVFPECDKKIFAAGACTAHYYRLWRTRKAERMLVETSKKRCREQYEEAEKPRIVVDSARFVRPKKQRAAWE